MYWNKPTSKDWKDKNEITSMTAMSTFSSAIKVNAVAVRT
jgi:hypothetical protein